MKTFKAIAFIAAFLTVHYSIYSQDIAANLQDFIGLNDSIVAITNITLIDGTGSPLKRNQDIVFTNNNIRSIGNTGEISIPANATLIDGTDKSLIPGFIMMHEHLFYAKPTENRYKAVHMPFTFPRMYLAGGVTTMRTAGSIEANTDLNVKNLIQEGKMIGPKIDVSTPHMEHEGFIPQLQSLYGNENIEDWLNYWFKKGVTSVKVYNHISKEELKEIIRVSHKNKIKVTGHLCSITYLEAAELGIDNLEHSFLAATDFVKNKPENECVLDYSSLLKLDDNDPKLMELMKSLIDREITLTYTPTVFEPFTNREVIPGGGINSLAPSLKKHLQGIYDNQINTKADSTSLVQFKKEMTRIRKFHALGGKLTVGTDPTGSGKTIAGYANQRAFELLIETGFALEEAVKIASSNGADYLGISEDTGTIEVGKKVDLILINGDLSKDISSIRKMEIVFKDGIGYDSPKIFSSVKGKVGLY